MQTLKLHYPFKIGGEPVTELTYDYSKFTGHEYIAAMDSSESGGKLTWNIAAQLVLASNRGKGWTPEDFQSLAGTDPLRFGMIGTDFFERARAELEEETTDAPPANSPSGSTSA